MGLVSAVAPLAAQAFGARNPRMVRRALRVGLWARAADLAADDGASASAASRSCSLLGQAPATRASRAAISVRPGVGHRCRRCGSSRSAASWARSTGRSRYCGSRWPRSRPMRCWSISLIHGALGLPRLGAVRRRARHLHRQFRHVPGGRCGLPRAAGRSGNITCSAASGASTGALMRQLDRHRRADLDLVPAGIRPVRRRRRC